MTSNTFLARLYRSPLVTLASIRGACPAGGCCLALCCDYRVMTAASGSIGLNEVALGISVPKFWGQLMQRVVGVGAADKLLQFALLIDPGRARALGLVDEVAPKEGLAAAGEAAMGRLLKVPDHGRAVSHGAARYATPLRFPLGLSALRAARCQGCAWARVVTSRPPPGAAAGDQAPAARRVLRCVGGVRGARGGVRLAPAVLPADGGPAGGGAGAPGGQKKQAVGGGRQGGWQQGGGAGQGGAGQGGGRGWRLCAPAVSGLQRPRGME